MPLITQNDLAKHAPEKLGKGPHKIAGMEIVIENPVGSERKGVGPDGKPWVTKMSAAYGRIKRVKGEDGEALDVFMGPNLTPKDIYIVNQQDPKTKAFDEQKVMWGWDSPESAKAAYLSHYDSPEHFRSMTTMPLETFKRIAHRGEIGSVRWHRKNKRKVKTGAIFSSEESTPLKRLMERMRGLDMFANEQGLFVWRTIGAVDHKGGTRVEIDGDGKIAKGPEGLVGHKPDAIPRKGQKTAAGDDIRQSEKKPSEPSSESKEESPKATEAKQETPKQPWKMSFKEYQEAGHKGYIAGHREEVIKAIRRGESVPAEAINSHAPTVEAAEFKKIADRHGEDFGQKLKDAASNVKEISGAHPIEGGKTRITRRQLRGGDFQNLEKGNIIKIGDSPKIVMKVNKPFAGRTENGIHGYYQDVVLRDAKPGEADASIAARDAIADGGRPNNMDYVDLKKQQMAHYASLVDKALGAKSKEHGEHFSTDAPVSLSILISRMHRASSIFAAEEGDVHFRKIHTTPGPNGKNTGGKTIAISNKTGDVVGGMPPAAAKKVSAEMKTPKPPGMEKVGKSLAALNQTSENPQQHHERLKRNMQSVVQQNHKNRGVGLSFDKLHEKLKSEHPSLTPEQFKKSAQDLEKSGKIHIGPFEGSRHDIPNKDIAYPLGGGDGSINTGKIAYNMYVPETSSIPPSAGTPEAHNAIADRHEAAAGEYEKAMAEHPDHPAKAAAHKELAKKSRAKATAPKQDAGAVAKEVKDLYDGAGDYKNTTPEKIDATMAKLDGLSKSDVQAVADGMGIAPKKGESSAALKKEIKLWITDRAGKAWRSSAEAIGPVSGRAEPRSPSTGSASHHSEPPASSPEMTADDHIREAKKYERQATKARAAGDNEAFKTANNKVTEHAEAARALKAGKPVAQAKPQVASPAPVAKPTQAVTRPQENRPLTEDDVIHEANELQTEKFGHYGGLVPMNELKSAIEKRFGPQSTEQLNKLVMGMRQNDRVRHVASSQDESNPYLSNFPEPSSASPYQPKPGIIPEESVHSGIRELSQRPENAGIGMVPIHQLREHIRAKHGDEAAAHKNFDPAIMQMRYADKLRAVPMSDMSRYTDDQKQASIPGQGETFGHIKIPDEYAAQRPAPVAQPQTAPTQPKGPLTQQAEDQARQIMEQEPASGHWPVVAPGKLGQYQPAKPSAPVASPTPVQPSQPAAPAKKPGLWSRLFGKKQQFSHDDFVAEYGEDFESDKIEVVPGVREWRTMGRGGHAIVDLKSNAVLTGPLKGSPPGNVKKHSTMAFKPSKEDNLAPGLKRDSGMKLKGGEKPDTEGTPLQKLMGRGKKKATAPTPPPIGERPAHDMQNELKDAAKSGVLRIPLDESGEPSKELEEAYGWIGKRIGVPVGKFRIEGDGTPQAHAVALVGERATHELNAPNPAHLDAANKHYWDKFLNKGRTHPETLEAKGNYDKLNAAMAAHQEKGKEFDKPKTQAFSPPPAPKETPAEAPAKAAPQHPAEKPPVEPPSEPPKPPSPTASPSPAPEEPWHANPGPGKQYKWPEAEGVAPKAEEKPPEEAGKPIEEHPHFDKATGKPIEEPAAPEPQAHEVDAKNLIDKAALAGVPLTQQEQDGLNRGDQGTHQAVQAKIEPPPEQTGVDVSPMGEGRGMADMEQMRRELGAAQSPTVTNPAPDEPDIGHESTQGILDAGKSARHAQYQRQGNPAAMPVNQNPINKGEPSPLHPSSQYTPGSHHPTPNPEDQPAFLGPDPFAEAEKPHHQEVAHKLLDAHHKLIDTLSAHGHLHPDGTPVDAPIPEVGNAMPAKSAREPDDMTPERWAERQKEQADGNRRYEEKIAAQRAAQAPAGPPTPAFEPPKPVQTAVAPSPATPLPESRPEESANAPTIPNNTDRSSTPSSAGLQPPAPKQADPETFRAAVKANMVKGMPRHVAYDSAVASHGSPMTEEARQALAKAKPVAPSANQPALAPVKPPSKPEPTVGPSTNPRLAAMRAQREKIEARKGQPANAALPEQPVPAPKEPSPVSTKPESLVSTGATEETPNVQPSAAVPDQPPPASPPVDMAGPGGTTATETSASPAGSSVESSPQPKAEGVEQPKPAEEPVTVSPATKGEQGEKIPPKPAKETPIQKMFKGKKEESKPSAIKKLMGKGKTPVTPDIAHAVGTDAGNASAKGKPWSQEDYGKAAKARNELADKTGADEPADRQPPALTPLQKIQQQMKGAKAETDPLKMTREEHAKYIESIKTPEEAAAHTAKLEARKREVEAKLKETEKKLAKLPKSGKKAPSDEIAKRQAEVRAEKQARGEQPTNPAIAEKAGKPPSPSQVTPSSPSAARAQKAKDKYHFSADTTPISRLFRKREIVHA